MSNRTAYDRELSTLDATLQSMGEFSLQSLELVLCTLADGDLARLDEISERKNQLGKQEREVEHQCMVLLLRQQPVASDFRKVNTSLRVVEDLRRIGDFCDDMTDILRAADLDALRAASFHAELGRMGENAYSMAERGIRAFRVQNCDLARAVIADDDVVDNAFVSLRDGLINSITEKPESASLALDYLMLAKYLERLADHAVNIAEWTLFCATGLYKNQRIV